MKLSTKTRYGLRAAIMLAECYGDLPVMATVIAEREKISKKYLEQLLTLLKNSGIVVTVRGKNGGYKLAKDPEQISAFEVITTLEGPLQIVHCTEKPEKCCKFMSCVAADLWQEIYDTITNLLKTTSLKNLADKSLGKTNSEMFHI
jgi:Rrf2 family protein